MLGHFSDRVGSDGKTGSGTELEIVWVWFGFKAKKNRNQKTTKTQVKPGNTENYSDNTGSWLFFIYKLYYTYRN